jgi:ribosomal protein S18 acetylase RimI-like enzyme
VIVEIRPMQAGDVSAVTTVHLAAFPNFFLSSLGPRFLRELYRAIIADDDGIALVAVDGARVVGFAAGTASGDFYRRVARRRWFRFGVAAFGTLMRKPSVARRLARTIYAPPRPTSAGALLMSLAVDPAIQGTGLGEALTRAFVEGARQQGARAVVLTTDQANNDAVNAFYQRRGFTVAAEYETAKGRTMNEYVMRID